MVLSQALVSPATIVIGDTFTVTSTLTPEATISSVVAELWGRINQGAWLKAATKTVGNVTINVPVTISIPCPATQIGTAEVYITVYQSTNPPPTGPYQDSPHAIFTISEVTPPPPPFPWWIPAAIVGVFSIVGIGIYVSRRKKTR